MENCCQPKCFEDHVSACPDTIKVNAKLEPNKTYWWRIKDYHGNYYSIEFTTDEDGYGTIDTSELPEGLCNSASHGITIQVSENESGCDFVPLKFLTSYHFVSLSFSGGTEEKSEIGCPHD